jgi:hypothetical protein
MSKTPVSNVTLYPFPCKGEIRLEESEAGEGAVFMIELLLDEESPPD